MSDEKKTLAEQGLRKMSKQEFLDRWAIDTEERKRRKAYEERRALADLFGYKKEIRQRILGRIHHMNRR